MLEALDIVKAAWKKNFKYKKRKQMKGKLFLIKEIYREKII